MADAERDERVASTHRFTYFGQRLVVDIGESGSVRFTEHEKGLNVQISREDFQKLIDAFHDR